MRRTACHFRVVAVCAVLRGRRVQHGGSCRLYVRAVLRARARDDLPVREICLKLEAVGGCPVGCARDEPGRTGAMDGFDGDQWGRP